MTDEAAAPDRAQAGVKGAGRPASAGRFLSALREPGLRRFSTGTLAWGAAHQMTTASQGFVLFEMTDSTLWLAALGAAVGFPNMAAAIISGILSDRFSRKNLLMAGAAITALPMLTIAVLYALNALEPWHILLAGAAQGVGLALDWTSRLSLLPTMVTRRVMVSAISLDQSVFNAARIGGPLLAAFILGSAGPGVAYGVITGLFAAAIVVYTTFRPLQTQRTGSHGAVMAQLAEAARHMRSDSVLSINLLFTAVNALVLGGFVYLIPAFAKETFGAGETGLGALFGATGSGALCGAMLVAWRGGMSSAGAGLLVSNLLFCAAATLFAFTGSLALAAPCAFALGLFNAIHVALGISAIQVNVADEVRGRVTGVYELAWASFPLGGLVLGSLAAVTDLRWAVIAGALFVTVVTIGIFTLSPRMRHLRLSP